MAKERVKSREISIVHAKGAFAIFKIPGSSKQGYNFKGISDLKQVLSKEKARMLSVIKSQNPSSIYELSRLLDRNFKSVREDIRILKKFGLIELKPEQTKKRKRLRPVASVDVFNIKINL